MGLLRPNKEKYTSSEAERKSNGYAMEYIKKLAENIKAETKAFVSSVELKLTEFRGALMSFSEKISEYFDAGGEFDKLSDDLKKRIDTAEENFENNYTEFTAEVEKNIENKADKAEIPTKVSELLNDKGYLTEHQDISGKADKATTLKGYGITDAFNINETGAFCQNMINGIIESYNNTVQSTYAKKSDTLSGYGIIDAYTKEESDSGFAHSSDTYTKDEVNSLVGDIEMALDEKADMLEFATDLLNVHKIEDSGNYPFKALLLQGAVENPTIRVYGKNLIKPEFGTDSQYTFIEGKNIAFTNTVSSSVYPTIRLNSALPSGTYRLSVNVKTPPTVGTVLVYVQGKGGGYSNVMTIPTNVGSVSKSFTTDIMQIMFVVRGKDSFEISDLQLEAGNVVTEYKPYVEPQLVNIPYILAEGDSLRLENGAVKNNINGIEEDITNTQTGHALLALHANYPSTTIICDTDCKAVYKADTTNAFKKLNGELDTLKQAIINLGGTI